MTSTTTTSSSTALSLASRLNESSSSSKLQLILNGLNLNLFPSHSNTSINIDKLSFKTVISPLLSLPGRYFRMFRVDIHNTPLSIIEETINKFSIDHLDVNGKRIAEIITSYFYSYHCQLHLLTTLSIALTNDFNDYQLKHNTNHLQLYFDHKKVHKPAATTRQKRRSTFMKLNHILLQQYQASENFISINSNNQISIDFSFKFEFTSLLNDIFLLIDLFK